MAVPWALSKPFKHALKIKRSNKNSNCNDNMNLELDGPHSFCIPYFIVRFLCHLLCFFTYPRGESAAIDVTPYNPVGILGFRRFKIFVLILPSIMIIVEKLVIIIEGKIVINGKMIIMEKLVVIIDGKIVING